MYFPTSAAKRLSTVPALPNIPPEPVLHIFPSSQRSHFCSLTRHGISVWSTRPSILLGTLSRTPTSLAEHGDNLLASWSPDGSRIVIQTTLSYLVLVTVHYHHNEAAFAHASSARGPQTFSAGPGEGQVLHAVSLYFEGVIHIDGVLLSVSPRKNSVLFSTQKPPAIQRIPWPNADMSPGSENKIPRYESWLLDEDELPWLVESEVAVSRMQYSRSGAEIWLTSDGRVYFVQLSDVRASEDPGETITEPARLLSGAVWKGTCVYDFPTPKWVQKRRQVNPDDAAERHNYNEPRRAACVAINGAFSMLAVGTQSGTLEFIAFPSLEGVVPPAVTVHVPNPYNRQTGSACCMEWSSDGYVLAVGWQHGWGVFSVGGRCLASAFGMEDVDPSRFQDMFMNGVSDLFWGPGNFELFVLPQTVKTQDVDGQLFAISFAKSATAGQHSPDNTRYAFLQMDDRVLVYRGADQPDMAVINPESDVWQHIKLPQTYIAKYWPVRYSSLSSDGRLIAIAGERGLAHYSSTSGRWKTFVDPVQEQAFVVSGGLIWFHHVLIAAVEIGQSYQLRLYSRDLDLSNQNVLCREVLTSPVVILSLVDNSLLVYTADNTLYHFVILPTSDSIRLLLCGSITFNGIIASPGSVRMLSWMIPSAHKQLGDPVDDLSVATVLMMVGGQLVLLRPRKSANHQVNYDLQIFADRIEFCWIHLRGIGALENSLWAYDGQGMRVWLNALSIEGPDVQMNGYASLPQSVQESVNIPLDFYPLSVLMDKGIIIGAEHEAATRYNLPFVMFRHATSSHLFLHHILLFHLEAGEVKEAVALATFYQNLVFFAHALEILLHTVVESEANMYDDLDSSLDSKGVLPKVVEFLDYFDVALDVVVGCARKTEMTRWRRLFNIVGNPKNLFEVCLSSNRLKTAASYLLVLHNLEQLDEDHEDVVRLLGSAVDQKDYQLCRELLRFLRSIDDSGKALKDAMLKFNLLSVS